MLTFGTAGIRAQLGDGDDKLNLKTVRAAASAILQHVASLDPQNLARGLCVAFDGRSQSDAFAREVCEVALGLGFSVRAWETPKPTPLLAFCTRHHGAAVGLMITASHNPPSDNGIKVYLAGGAQLAAPHDRAILERLRGLDATESIPRLPIARAGERYRPFRPADLDPYLAAILALAPRGGPERKLPRVAYSALCGVGAQLALSLLEAAGADDVACVEAQREPRADFGGLAYPNPEADEALSALRSHAEAEHAELAFAHDPDADRLAVLARDPEGVLHRLSGDDVGALLGSYLLSRAQQPEQQLVVSTHVSGGCLEALCQARGAEFSRTHTGFKWIAGAARTLSSERLRYLFGYEEAIGYAFGALGDDKDGLAALYVLCALARDLSQQGRTLCCELDRLESELGVFRSRQLSVRVTTQGGPAALFAQLCATPPRDLLGMESRVETCSDGSDAPPLLVLRAGSALRVCFRPSGTEPKLKAYLHGYAPAVKGVSLGQTRRDLDASLTALKARLLSSL